MDGEVKKMKRMILLGFLAILAFGAAACGLDSADSWASIEDRGYFVVGLDDTFAPMGFRNPNSELVGFDVDLAKEVALRLGLEVRFQPIDWDAKVLELNAKNIDVIWNGLTITEPRRSEMLFSLPYLANRQIVIVRGLSGISTLADLSGKKVGVQISSAAEEAVVANTVSSSFAQLVKYDNYTTALLELRQGLVDAIVIDEIMGRYMISQIEDNLWVLTEDFGAEEYGIGFRLGDQTFRDRVQEVLREMFEDGTTAAISQAWFGEDVFLNPNA
jgi:polar amino acid transport system substrate-binding protein